MFHPFRSKAACCIFFLLPGLFYGLVMARLPAIKVHADLSDSVIGLCLFCVGVFGLLGLMLTGRMIARFGSTLMLCASALIEVAGLSAIGFGSSQWMIFLGFSLMGFGISVLDVAVNTQGVLYEHRSRRPTMNLFHAFYSLGAVLASVIGSLCAARGISIGTNFLAAAVPFVLLALLLRVYLLPDRAPSASVDKKSMSPWRRAPLVVFVCALMAMLAYAAEGTVGEWGALYLDSFKDSGPALAALVYGTFSVVTCLARLAGDPLRKHFGEMRVITIGLVLSFIGMTVVLWSSSPYVVLGAYALMGLGLAPVVPTLFSIAGRNGVIAASEATGIVAFMAYGGLLLVPPTIGWLAEHTNLHEALFVALGLLGMLILSSLILRRQPVLKRDQV